MNVFQNREILIGVTGGISAYKSADLTSKLIQAGAFVTVAMTEAAKKFVKMEGTTERGKFERSFIKLKLKSLKKLKDLKNRKLK